MEHNEKKDIWEGADVDKQIQALQGQGVKYLRWHEYSQSCDICSRNAGQVVEVGKAFNTGHTLPPGHPNCICTVEELKEKPE